jgi:hypothetical protein
MYTGGRRFRKEFLKQIDMVPNLSLQDPVSVYTVWRGPTAVRGKDAG